MSPRSMAEFAAEQEAAIQSRKLSIFLCGPSISLGRRMTRRKEDQKLRYYLYTSLEQTGHTVYLGEHNAVQTTGRRLLRRRGNWLDTEILHASRHSDLIVILPTSPGSFAELGAFTQIDMIMNKLIIIADQRFKDSKTSFIVNGPMKSARENKAKVYFRDYSDKGAVLKLVEKSIRDWQIRDHLREIRRS